MWFPPEQQAKLDAAIAQFPATFKLSSYPEMTFRINANNSYVSDGTVYLYLDALVREQWTAFVKGTPGELRRYIY